jgi:putative colanic acid biosynthesis UDP-glucose lipid carrier transferase
VVLLALLAIPTKYLIRKKIHAALHKGNYYDNVLLVGASSAAANFYETVKKYYYYGYKCIGYINTTNSFQNDCNYFGNFDNVEEIITGNPIDEVFIALPSSENNNIQKIIRICEINNIRVRMLPDLTEYTSSSIYINNIGLVPVVNVGHLPLDKKENRILKRGFDIVFSVLFFLTIGIFIFPIIAFIIKITSRGPIFFKQERWGHGNKKITCYKFRSMLKNSSDIDHDGKYNQAFKNDPRITLIGRILRKTNLDELYITYNIDVEFRPNKQLPNTILVHRKKQSNTLYTINALNQLIKEENGGILDTSFSLDWDKFRNCIILTGLQGIRKVPTRIFEKIEFN